MGNMETYGSARRGSRGQAGRALRGVLAGSVIACSVAIGGGALVATAPAGAASSASGTCTPALAPTPAQDAATTGITAKSVTVGNVSIISGPVPGLFQGAPIGAEAYFDMINAQGGVDGRKLLVDSKDDAFSGQQNMTETQEAINSDFALVGSFSLFDGYGCAALASDTAVPDVSVTLDSGTNALPNDFSAQPLSGQETLGPVAYYKKHYPEDTTVGAIISDVSSAETQMAQQFAGLKSMGYKIAYVDDINPLQSDFTTDVINMKDKGVNAVDLTGIDWQDAAIFIENAETQNWHPGLIFSGGPVYADQFISHAGGPAATNGIQIGQVYALYLGEDAEQGAGGQAVRHLRQEGEPVLGSRPLHALRLGFGRDVRPGAQGGGASPDPRCRHCTAEEDHELQRRRALRWFRPGSQDGDALLLDGRHQKREVRPRAADRWRVRLQREVVQRIWRHGLGPGLRLGCPGVGKR